MTEIDVPRKAAPQLLDLQRLLFLTDGVFAITITLLVLDLKLASSSPRVLAFVVGFISIYVAFAIWLLWPVTAVWVMPRSRPVLPRRMD
jgi:uncharacterized membrane protein